MEPWGRRHLEVPPSELQVMTVGLDALGFEWHVAGLAPGQALGWPERHVPAKARALSSRRDITYEAYFMPSWWPLSPECHVSVTGSCWIWSSAVPGSICLEAGYCLSASWFFRRLILQIPAELLTKGFHLRKKEMLCTPLLKDCWSLGHQVK